MITVIPNPAPCELPKLPGAIDPKAEPIVAGTYELHDYAGHDVFDLTVADSVVVERGRWEDTLVYTSRLQDWIAAADACIRKASPPGPE